MTKIPQAMNKALFIVFLFLAQNGYSQNFQYKTKLSYIDQSGYVKIKLNPLFLTICKSDLADVRLLDDKGREVPYFLRQNTPMNKLEFSTYDLKVIRIKNVKNSFTELIVENDKNQELNQFTLTINNAEVSKEYSIEGSQDLKHWYAVSQGILTDLKNPDNLSINKEIALPKTNYYYYKISLKDSATAPIRISRIFVEYYSKEWQSIRTSICGYNLRYSIKENDNLIQVKSNHPYRLNEILFDIDQKSFFKREFRIYHLAAFKKKILEQTLYTGEISNNQTIISGLDMNDTSFYIQIFNHNNQPMSITNISFYQHPTYLIADLATDCSYFLCCGKSGLTAPIYDLNYIQDKISDSLPIINMPELKMEDSKSKTKPTSFYEREWFLWTVLVLGSIVIIFISYQMIKRINQ